MIHRIEVITAEGQPDSLGASLLGRIRRFSDFPLDNIVTCSVYLLDSAALAENGSRAVPDEAARRELLQMGEELFTDPILHDCRMDGGALEIAEFDWYVEVGYRPGVTDNVGRTAQESLEYRLGRPLAAGHHVHSAMGYFISGEISREQVEALAAEWLGNDLIQQAVVLARADFPARKAELFGLPRVTLNQPVTVEYFPLDSRQALESLSQERLLALSGEEIEAIQDHFSKPKVQETRRAAGLESKATDVELEMLAQTWSEHCKHKIFNAEIGYTDETGNSETIRSLYKTYIQGATRKVREALGAEDWCLSVFTDNAGVVRFDDDWSFVFKVETHNSPSALDPYGGALTGIVGVNRDPFGTGRGAELLFNTDVFCFASPFHDEPLPPRLLHPRRIYEGVRLGVEHGGNKSGVPTINGSITFHPQFLGKPLVFCGTGGLLPARIGGKPGHEKWINPGDKIVMVGGRIGKDGIHGATFSSQELSESSPVTAVQIGDPITQKKMFDFLIIARDRGLINAITDNGAGGLSSSVGEMATMSGGAELHLDKAPLKYPGLQPWEILISEAQERMSLAVAPENIDALLALSARMDVESTVLGDFNASGMFHALHEGRTVALLDMNFLHDGLPTMKIKAHWQPPAQKPCAAQEQGTSMRQSDARSKDSTARQDHSQHLLAVLGRLNVCSKESMIRQYDHEVQGASVIKPLVGEACDGPSDAAVIRPLLESMRGLAISHGICPRYSELDTYHMAACAMDEAVRSIVAVGGNPERIAGLDNFCWCDPLPSPGNPDATYKAAQLVRAVRGLYDTAVAYGVPLISGKDSMKNDYVWGEKRISIPPTLLVSAVGIVDDVRKAVTMDVKAAGDRVFLLGDTREELGGSEYYLQLGIDGGGVPTVQTETARNIYIALGLAMAGGMVSAAHDCSDGGLAVTLAEMAFSGGLGMKLELGALATLHGLAPAALLFSETPSRLVVTVNPARQSEFETAMAGLPCRQLGEVTKAERLVLKGGGDGPWIDTGLGKLKAAWQGTLKEF